MSHYLPKKLTHIQYIDSVGTRLSNDESICNDSFRPTKFAAESDD